MNAPYKAAFLQKIFKDNDYRLPKNNVIMDQKKALK